MNHQLVDLATAAGHSWAERRAESLAPEFSPHDWPDVWEPSWEGRWPFRPDEVPAAEVEGLKVVAKHAAAERWREILIEARSGENAVDEEHDQEAEAERLLQRIGSDLPPGLEAHREGERVFVTDRDGFERTLHSLEHAWVVVAEYEERHSLRT